MNMDLLAFRIDIRRRIISKIPTNELISDSIHIKYYISYDFFSVAELI